MKQRRISLVVIIFILLFGQNIFAAKILTASERSDFSRLTSYPEMMEYLQDVQGSSKDMLLGVFGRTVQGRNIPYAIFSRPLVTKGWEAMSLKRPIIVLTANIHGEETNLRESILILTRQLATKDTIENKLLDKLVVIVVPSLNPDGFVLETHINAADININRDFIKAESVEMESYLKNILQTWHPHLFIDGHGGGPWPYNLCYQAPSNAACDIRITDLFDKKIVPFIDKKMAQSHYKSWYFAIGNRTEWVTGIVDADNGRNYGGFINSVGILYESPASQDLKTATLSGVVGYTAVLQYAAENADELMMVVNRARKETIEAKLGPIAVQVDKVAEDYPVSYEVGVKRNANGEMKLFKDQGDAIEKITGAKLIKKPVVTKSRPRPYAYVLPSHLKDAVALLKRQNITIEVLQKDTQFDVEAYQLVSFENKKKYEHELATFVTVADQTKKFHKKFAKGSFVIRTGQAMGRVVCHMLEPETDDNVITFNTMDKLLGHPGGLVPIYKIMKPTKMSTMALDY